MTKEEIGQKLEFHLQIFNSVQQSVIVTDKNEKIILWNSFAEKLYGYSQNEAIGKTMIELIAPVELTNEASEKNEEISKGKKINTEYLVKNKEGKGFLVSLKNSPIRNSDGDVIGSVGISEEITEKRKNEREWQQERVLSIIKGEENERARISQELHDGLGPLMSTLNLFMQGIAKVDDPAKIKEFAQKSQGVFNEILQTISEVSNNLSPHILRQFGLFTALKTYVEKIKKTSNIHFNLNFNYNHFQSSICSKTQKLCKLSNRFKEIYEITLYRIITELIHNTIKHSEATLISLKIDKRNHSLFVNYSDNGVGFDLDSVFQNNLGLGLNNMQNRVKNINGIIKFDTSPNNGFKTEIIIECECKIV